MLDLGVDLINDIYGFVEQETQTMIAKYNCAVCIMHMQNTPDNMQDNPVYDDVLAEISSFLYSRATELYNHGIAKNRIIIDPGFGFGKTLEHNIRLLKHFHKLQNLGYACLAGLSRKSFLGQITGKNADERLSASLAGAMLALQNGANILRVHDVDETRDILQVFNHISKFI
jgi:dihydropteroate synthase